MFTKEKKLFMKNAAKLIGLNFFICFVVLSIFNYWRGEPLLQSTKTIGIICIALFPVFVWAMSRLWDYRHSAASDSDNRPTSSENSR